MFWHKTRLQSNSGKTEGKRQGDKETETEGRVSRWRVEGDDCVEMRDKVIVVNLVVGLGGRCSMEAVP